MIRCGLSNREKTRIEAKAFRWCRPDMWLLFWIEKREGKAVPSSFKNILNRFFTMDASLTSDTSYCWPAWTDISGLTGIRRVIFVLVHRNMTLRIFRMRWSISPTMQFRRRGTVMGSTNLQTNSVIATSKGTSIRRTPTNIITSKLKLSKRWKKSLKIWSRLVFSSWILKEDSTIFNYTALTFTSAASLKCTSYSVTPTPALKSTVLYFKK